MNQLRPVLVSLKYWWESQLARRYYRGYKGTNCATRVSKDGLVNGSVQLLVVAALAVVLRFHGGGAAFEDGPDDPKDQMCIASPVSTITVRCADMN